MAVGELAGRNLDREGAASLAVPQRERGWLRQRQRQELRGRGRAGGARRRAPGLPLCFRQRASRRPQKARASRGCFPSFRVAFTSRSDTVVSARGVAVTAAGGASAAERSARTSRAAAGGEERGASPAPTRSLHEQPVGTARLVRVPGLGLGRERVQRPL